MFSHSSPAECCKKIRDSLATEEKAKERQSKINKWLEALKSAFDVDPFAVSKECVDTDFFYFIVPKMNLLDFDSQSVLSALFDSLLSNSSACVSRFAANATLCELLLKNCRIPATYLQSGKMLRSCISHGLLIKQLLSSQQFWTLFQIARDADFDMSSSGFATLKSVLVSSESQAFLESNKAELFVQFRNLIKEGNYVTKRETLHLLGDILLDKANYNLMESFVKSSTNLKVIMNVMIEMSKSVRFEAFHIFKLFLANPNKPPLVIEIFKRNKAQLLAYIENFHPREEDEQLEEEKEYLLEQLNKL